MFNVHVEMPSGMKSKGYDPFSLAFGDRRFYPGVPKDERPEKVFDSIVAQIQVWRGFSADVVMTDDTGGEVRRTHVEG